MNIIDRLSPRSRLTGPINTIHKTCDFAIATFTWDGKPDCMGMCWTGDQNDPDDKGNPRSHGEGTWFIVPEPFAHAIKLCRLAIDVACKYYDQQQHDKAA